MPEARHRLRCGRHAAAWAWRCVNLVAYFTRKLIAADRLLFLESRAADAARAARSGDMRATYGIVRSLSRRSAGSQPSHIRLPSGELTRTDDKRDAAWLAHFKGVFQGKDATFEALGLRSAQPRLGAACTFSSEDAFLALRRLRSNKGVGPDGIHAEVLHAGGMALAEIALGVETLPFF